MESELMMEAELRSGKLVMPVAATPKLEIATQWLVCPRSNLRRHRVMRLIEWLRAEAALWRETSPSNTVEFLK